MLPNQTDQNLHQQAPHLGVASIKRFVLVAAIPILFAKVFFDLAMAGPSISSSIVLNEPASAMGTYRVKDIYLKANYYTGSICVSYVDSTGNRNQPDRDCDLHLWAYRTPNQLAFLQMTPKTQAGSDLLESGLLYSKLFSSSCRNIISVESAREGIFSSKLCRASRAPTLDSKKNEVFVFHDEMIPVAEGKLASLIQAYSVALFPTSVSKKFKIQVPRNELEPKRIVITNQVNGVFLFFPASYTKTFILERVSN